MCGPVIEGFRQSFQNLKADFQAGGLGQVWKNLVPDMAPALDKLRDLGGKIGNAIATVAPKIETQLGTWAAAFAGWIPGATTKFLTAWPSMLNSVLDTIGNAAVKIAPKFAEWIGPAIPKMLKALLGIQAAIATFILETSAVIAAKLVVWGLKLTEWIIPHIPAMLGKLGTLLDKLVAWIKSDAAPKIEAQAGVWATKISAWVMDKGWPLLKSDLAQLMTQFTSWLTGTAGPQITAAAAKWPGDLKAGLGNALTLLNNAGTQIVQGLINGISSMGPQLTSFVTGFVKSHIPGPVASILKIFSPSQVMHEMGQNVVQGLINGIQDKGASLHTTMARVATDLYDKFAAHPHVRAKSPAAAYIDLGKSLMDGLALGITQNQQRVLVALGRVASTLYTGFNNPATAGGYGNLKLVAPSVGSFAGTVGMGGPATVTVHTTVHVEGGTGSQSQNQQIGQAIGDALGEFTRQMVGAGKSAANSVPHTMAGAHSAA